MWNWLALTFDYLAESLRAVDWRLAVPVVGSLVAAFFGAYTAQRIIERREIRQKLSREIRNANVATTLSLHIANAFIGMKKQHVKQLYDDYHLSKTEVVQALKVTLPSGQRPEFHYRADLEHLPTLELPTEHLQRIVADEISVIGRPLLLPTMIRQVVRSQIDAVNVRNRMIDEFKKASLPHNDFAALYFGLRGPRGVDNIYGTTVDAINAYTNDCIYFSIRLSEDLAVHARGLQQRYADQYRDKPPSVASADFSKVEEGLLPSRDDYADWEKMAPKPVAEKVSRRRFWRLWTKRRAT